MWSRAENRLPVDMVTADKPQALSWTHAHASSAGRISPCRV